jgi:hypothetical protein
MIMLIALAACGRNAATRRIFVKTCVLMNWYVNAVYSWLPIGTFGAVSLSTLVTMIFSITRPSLSNFGGLVRQVLWSVNGLRKTLACYDEEIWSVRVSEKSWDMISPQVDIPAAAQFTSVPNSKMSISSRGEDARREYSAVTSTATVVQCVPGLFRRVGNSSWGVMHG